MNNKTSTRRMNQSRWSHPDESMDLESVLTVLQDDECRQLWEAASTDQLTAKEFAERCDIPLTTVYRKLDLLTDTSIFEESLRLDPHGSHISEYHLSFESLTISVDTHDGLDIDILTPT